MDLNKIVAPNKNSFFSLVGWKLAGKDLYFLIYIFGTTLNQILKVMVRSHKF